MAGSDRTIPLVDGGRDWSYFPIMDRPLSPKEAQRRLTDLFPQLEIGTLEYIGQGLGNVTFLVNEKWLFRFSKREVPATFHEEIELLKLLQEKLSYPVPNPQFVHLGEGVSGYSLLHGRPLLELLPIDQEMGAKLLSHIGNFLHQLHGIQRSNFQFFREDDGDLLGWWSDSRASYAEIRAEISEKHRRDIDRFFSDFPGTGGSERVFCHNDLGVEHILTDLEAQTMGVIDWSEASWADPAHDFGRLARDLGKEFLDLLLQNYRYSSDLHALRTRSVFVAKCALIEDLHYGLKSNAPLYSSKSFAKIDEFFAE